MFEDAFELSQKLITAWDKKGEQESEIYLSYNNKKEVTINGTSINTQRVKEELGVGIRVIKNGSIGFTYTNIITKDSLQKCFANALSIAKQSAKIDGVGLTSKQKYKQLNGLYNKEIIDLSVDEITNDALAFVDGFTGIDKRISTMLSGLSTDDYQIGILNSHGLEAIRKNAYYQAGLIAIASEAGKSGAYVFDNVFSRKHDVDLKTIGEKLGKKAIDNLNQSTITPFEGEVIFQPEAIFNPIVTTIGLSVSADWRQRGRSFWKDKLGDKVCSEKLNFVDKPYDLSGGSNVRPFDEEGNATNELEIIKEGVLKTFLHDQRTANKENLKSTGNAYRQGGVGFNAAPNLIFPNAPWILPGDMSEEEIIAETKKGIIFHNYQGTIRNESGVFSGVAKGAYLIEDGEIKQPITGVSISGNVFEILNQITGIGKELHLANGLIKSPFIKFKGIKISS